MFATTEVESNAINEASTMPSFTRSSTWDFMTSERISLSKVSGRGQKSNKKEVGEIYQPQK